MSQWKLLISQYQRLHHIKQYNKMSQIAPNISGSWPSWVGGGGGVGGWRRGGLLIGLLQYKKRQQPADKSL